MKYPPGWTVLPQGHSVFLNNVSDPTEPVQDEAEFQSVALFSLTRLVDANSAELPLAEWFDRYFAGFSTPPISRDETDLGGQPAIRLVGSEFGGDRVHFYLRQGRDIVEMSYRLSVPQFVPLYEQIAESVRLAPFVEKKDTSTSSTSLTASWQTYRNEEYGFEFKYPPGGSFTGYIPTPSTVGGALWIAGSLGNGMLMDVEVYKKSAFTDPHKSVENGGFTGEERWTTPISFGYGPETTLAYLKSFPPIDECYGVEGLRGGCDDQFVVIADNADYWFVIVGKLYEKMIPSQYKAVLTTFNLFTPTGTPPSQVMCTADAKQCPDGSYVGRTGPNCEFAPCPGN